jgi:phage terminase large subunit GpA-like protein
MNTARDIRIPLTSPWYSGDLHGGAKTVRLSLRFSAAERKIFRKRRKIPVSRWTEQHRVVTMSVLPGRWDNSVTPYLAGIMDASFFPSVREIDICAAPQTGKSEAVNNCIGYAVDRAPGPAIMVYPDEKLSDENSEDRIQAMITSSRRLRSYMTGIADDLSKKRINLRHMPIYFGWARSASTLSNKPCRYAVNDEVDKYPETSGKRETGPIQLTKGRLTTYLGQEKHWIISSPSIEAGPIWRAFLTAQVRFEYRVICPACGTLQLMEFGQIKWAHKTEPDADGKCHSEDPGTIEAENLAWYECPHCLKEWRDYDRDLAVRRGRWQDRETGMELFDYLRNHEPAIIAFHIPSWISRFVPLAKPVASFLRGQNDLTEFKDFHNKHAALPWKQIIVTTTRDRILTARCDLPPQTVPQDAVALTAGIDRQKYGFWFVVRAWARDYTSWLIHYGYLRIWEEVEELLFAKYYPVRNTDRQVPIWRAAIDIGGSEGESGLSMTEETYWWLRYNAVGRGCRVWGSKGSSRPLAGKINIGKPRDRTPGGKPIPGGLQIISLDTDKLKDAFHYRLNQAIENLPRAAYLHAETGRDYAAQILAEEKQKNQRGIEKWVQVKKDNHLLDCECLCAACADPEWQGGGVNLLRPFTGIDTSSGGPVTRIARSIWMQR